ncbi:MAG: DNA polymerase I [Thermodesulfobacteria bacterium]|nr:DNA polymerase I [Thermodesulfobacteriota bacterium]
MKPETEPTIYVVDGSSYLYRAYFSTHREFTSSAGLPTRAIYVMTNMMLKILREKDPEYILVAWDAKGPTFRHELYEDYKANRPPMPEDLSIQVPYIREVIDALGIPQMEISGFEADDIMAAVAKKMGEQQHHRVILVTGDKDMRQLVSEHVVLWDPMKDKITDLEAFRGEFGIEPAQYPDVQALSGDSSDNIPGVPGVGPKTALKLIRQFGSIENLVENLESLKASKLKERLIQHKDMLPLWKRLASLDDNLPVEITLESMKRREPDKKRLTELFKKLDFESLLSLFSNEEVLEKDKYQLIFDKKKLADWLDSNLSSSSCLVIDTETTSQHPMEANLVGVSLCFSPPEAVYVPVGHKGAHAQMAMADLLEVLSPLLENKELEKVGQNIKYDLIVLNRHGLEVENIAGDTMIASYLLDPTKRRHNLDEIARDVLGHKMISYKEVTKGLKRDMDFSHVPPEKAMEYSCEDVHVTALVRERFHEKLKKMGLWNLYSDVEVPLIEVLAKMEMNGVLIDQAGLEELEEDFSKRLSEYVEKIYELAGCEFNINSTRQLAQVLFEKLNLPQLKKTKKKTGYSTDVEVLKALSKLHPLPETLLKYRNLAKLKSTYIDGLKRQINPETNRIHTSFNQTVTATGRLSSSEPNLQNIPVRTDEGRRIRALFIAEQGSMLVAADYSQIDLRVLAHYSQDENLLKAFRNDEDIHKRTASLIFHVEPQFVTKDMRRVAKTVNFGIIYGMSAYGLAKELDISRKEAKEFIDAYFQRHPGVKRYMEETIARCRESGYVETILGRRRYIKDIRAKSRNIRQFAERTAINTPIQGSAADIIKLAMLRVHERFEENTTNAKLLLQVHDELVVECPEEVAPRVAQELREIMENVVELRVPLKVSVGMGKNWNELK